MKLTDRDRDWLRRTVQHIDALVMTAQNALDQARRECEEIRVAVQGPSDDKATHD